MPTPFNISQEIPFAETIKYIKTIVNSDSNINTTNIMKKNTDVPYNHQWAEKDRKQYQKNMQIQHIYGNCDNFIFEYDHQINNLSYFNSRCLKKQLIP